MKTFLTLITTCALAITLAACHNNKTDGNKASPGAMKDCPNCASGKCDCVCCKTGGAKMNTASGCCCAEGTTCCKAKASMGAVGEKKPDGCCASEKSGASLGAVSEKKSCTGVCPVTGKPLG